MAEVARSWAFTAMVFALLAMGGCPPTPDGGEAGPDGGGEGELVDGVQEGGGGGAPPTGEAPADAPGPSAPGDAGDDLSGEFSGDSQKLTAYRDKLTRDEAYHLLRRTQLGATEADVQRVMAFGLTWAVDDALVEKQAPAYVELLAASYEEDMNRRWLIYLLESPNVLQERMAMFWHDRFATSRDAATNHRERNLQLLHYEMLRRNSLGNYRQFLEALTLDPLMLLWLDGADSPKDNPNENYIREFWELFTLGRDRLYTEADIIEGARALTGITLLYPKDGDPRPIYDLLNHDETEKAIFPGRAAAANHNYETVIDLTLAQPEAAAYVARNLFVFFVHDAPAEETVNELARFFEESGYEIAPLVRRILRSQAMFSEAARYVQISSPVEHFVGVARTLDMHPHSEDSQGYILNRVRDDLREAGMELLDPPGVEGWTEGEAWLEDQWLMSRVKALGHDMEYGPDRSGELPYHLLPDPSRWGEREIREEIVNAIASVFHLELTDDELDIYVEVLDQNGHKAFHLLNPDQQPRHVAEMIRLMAMDERVICR